MLYFSQNFCVPFWRSFDPSGLFNCMQPSFRHFVYFGKMYCRKINEVSVLPDQSASSSFIMLMIIYFSRAIWSQMGNLRLHLALRLTFQQDQLCGESLAQMASMLFTNWFTKVCNDVLRWPPKLSSNVFIEYGKKIRKKEENKIRNDSECQD